MWGNGRTRGRRIQSGSKAFRAGEAGGSCQFGEADIGAGVEDSACGSEAALDQVCVGAAGEVFEEEVFEPTAGHASLGCQLVDSDGTME